MDAVSLSISYPNYRYFYPLRKNRYPDKSWVVIVLKPDILWEKDCAFCLTNAANKNMVSTFIYDRKGPKALESLFDEKHGMLNRRDLDIPSYYTTDSQAEVLVFGIIPPKYIKAIYYENSNLSNQIKSLGFKNVFLDDTYFKQRKDYKFWSNQGGYYGY